MTVRTIIEQPHILKHGMLSDFFLTLMKQK